MSREARSALHVRVPTRLSAERAAVLVHALGQCSQLETPTRES